MFKALSMFYIIVINKIHIILIVSKKNCTKKAHKFRKIQIFKIYVSNNI